VTWAEYFPKIPPQTMSREQLDKWCERAIFALVLVILVFGPLSIGAVRMSEFLVIQALTLGAGALWVARFWIRPDLRWFWPPICWAVLAFLAYAIVRYRQADIEYVGRLELMRVLVYVFLFFTILNNLYRQDYIHWTSYVLIFLAMADALYGIYQFVTQSHYVWHFPRAPQYGNRASGTFYNPNHLAGFLEMLLPLSLSFALVGRVKPVLRIFLLYASLVIVVGIAVTFSRGGLIAMALALVVFFLLLLRQRTHRIPALVTVGLVLVFGYTFAAKSDYVQRRFENIFKPGEDDTVSRQEIWRAAAQIWREHPWWGVGPAHFDYHFPAHRPPDPVLQARPIRAHNDYLNTLADWGIAGAAIITAAWVCLFLGVIKMWRFVRRDDTAVGSKTSNRLAFVLGATVGLIAILLHSFADFNMHVPANAVLVVTLMAMLTAHLRFASERYWISPGLVTRILLTAMTGAGLFYLGEQGLRLAQEDRWLQRANQAQKHSNFNQETSALHAAFSVEPMNFETTYRLGEELRIQSWKGDTNYVELAERALQWFQRGMQLNRYDPYNYLRYGMCLHWLERHAETGPYFKRAHELDPNNFFICAHLGWHYVQLGDYAAAKPWFERSIRLKSFFDQNPIAFHYLEIVNRRLAEAAQKR
jgi:O-antigen ligase